MIQVVRGIHNHNNQKRPVLIMKVVDEIREEVCNSISKPIVQIYNEHVAEYVSTICSGSLTLTISLETKTSYC